MTLQEILMGLGFGRGISIRYNSTTNMVMFFLNHTGHNPTVVQNGTLISVGTAPVQVHGKMGDARIRNPLHFRRDFDLNHPDSLEQIGEHLHLMMDRCESRKRRDRRI